MHYLYCITNLINKKIYVGKHSTFNIHDRYFGSSEILDAAVKKYGRKNFKKEIIRYCESEETMWETEREIVNPEFIKRKDTYNIVIGFIGVG